MVWFCLGIMVVGLFVGFSGKAAQMQSYGLLVCGIVSLLHFNKSIPPTMLETTTVAITTKNIMLVMLPRFHGFAKVRVSSIAFNRVAATDLCG